MKKLTTCRLTIITNILIVLLFTYSCGETKVIIKELDDTNQTSTAAAIGFSWNPTPAHKM